MTTDPASPSLLQNLRNRKLAQWLLAYAAGAWVLLQVLSLLIGAYHWPDGVLRIAIGIALIGAFITAVLAWYHGERGMQRATRGEIGLLAVITVLGALGIWLGERGRDPADRRHGGAWETRHRRRAWQGSRRIDRGAALRQHVQQCRQRIFLRRPVRGNPEFAGAHRRHAGGRTHVVVIAVFVGIQVSNWNQARVTDQQARCPGQRRDCSRRDTAMTPIAKWPRATRWARWSPSSLRVTDKQFDARSTVDAIGPADYYWRTPATVAASHQ